jgi:hypothetical protein
MFPTKRGIMHDSVANVLEGLGVRKKSKDTNLPNNAQFVNEGIKTVIGKQKISVGKPAAAAGKIVVEAEEVVGDETDGTEGDKPASTKVSNKPTGTTVSNKPADTECNNSTGTAAESEEEKKSLAFYEGIKRPLMITIKEDGSAEVHGLTEEELAPFGGKAPAVPKKYTQKDGKNDDNKKPYVGNLMLYSTEGMDKKTAILMGKAIQCAGWSNSKK